MVVICMDLKKNQVKLKLAKQNLLKIKKEKDTLIYLFFCLKCINNNNLRELKTNIKNLLNHLYDNKQITKQVYNILNKAITYKNDS